MKKWKYFSIYDACGWILYTMAQSYIHIFPVLLSSKLINIVYCFSLLFSLFSFIFLLAVGCTVAVCILLLHTCIYFSTMGIAPCIVVIWLNFCWNLQFTVHIYFISYIPYGSWFLCSFFVHFPPSPHGGSFLSVRILACSFFFYPQLNLYTFCFHLFYVLFIFYLFNLLGFIYINKWFFFSKCFK